MTGCQLMRGAPGAGDTALRMGVCAAYVRIPTAASEEATRLFARLEGIALDPTYGAKAAAGLIDLVRRGAFRPDETVLFWHTGGATWHVPPGAQSSKSP